MVNNSAKISNKWLLLGIASIWMLIAINGALIIQMIRDTQDEQQQLDVKQTQVKQLSDKVTATKNDYQEVKIDSDKVVFAIRNFIDTMYGADVTGETEQKYRAEWSDMATQEVVDQLIALRQNTVQGTGVFRVHQIPTQHAVYQSSKSGKDYLNVYIKLENNFVDGSKSKDEYPTFSALVKYDVQAQKIVAFEQVREAEK